MSAFDTARDYPAPAKINLFLHITGRRADGYHTLQTAFRFLDHGDVLRFALRDDGVIARATDIPGVPAEHDLTVRAAHALREAAGPAYARCGVSITLTKRLPMGGGLGGGSSDAATVLVVLNALWGVGLPREQLMQIGLRLGADVPVFVFGQAAFAQGVGEALTPIALPPAWYLVVEPPVQVSTAEIFSASELTRDTKVIRMPDFSAGLPLEIAGLRNDLQPAVRGRYPVVGEVIDTLSALAAKHEGTTRMSGSGACVFAEFATEAQALRAQADIAPRGWRGWVAKGLDHHPLAG